MWGDDPDIHAALGCQAQCSTDPPANSTVSPAEIIQIDRLVILPQIVYVLPFQNFW